MAGYGNNKLIIDCNYYQFYHKQKREIKNNHQDHNCRSGPPISVVGISEDHKLLDYIRK